MTATRNFIHELSESRDVAVVGGKGANLGTLVRAGFPVPQGFVVDTRAYVRAKEVCGGKLPHAIPPEVEIEIRSSYRAMGGGAVAVRSSATAEDMEGASMAGQYETFLDVEGEEELLAKVQECWASMDAPRIRAYLEEHGIERSRVAMAVVVQRLVPSEVAGVLFTINPNGNGRAMREMLIEASWGLGESVVGGRVQPDVLRLERETGRLIEAVIADKKVELTAGVREERTVEEARRKQACLGEEEVKRLWELGQHAAAHFGVPQDIEWALHEGRLYMLQSRPITTAREAEAAEKILTETQARLKKDLAAGRGPWALHNLAETLAHPTPLTWSVIQRFMSGDGGFGAMYRMAGFEPAALVCREGFLDRIAGRVYMDASRAPEMFFENFPYAYDVEELKRNPNAAQNPPTIAQGTWRARRRVGKRLAAANAKLRRLAGEFDRQLREVHFPGMAAYVESSRRLNLTTLSAERLVDVWRQHEKRVMDEFAPLSLMPSMICGMALEELRTFLEEHFWNEDAEALAQLVSAGGLANRTVMADAELYEVGRGIGDRGKGIGDGGNGNEGGLAKWVEAHGHRAPGEFDLAAARWRERPSDLLDMARRMAAAGSEQPLERHRRVALEVNRKVEELRARLQEPALGELERRIDLVRRYVPFREDGKDFLMLGYELLRWVALEAGRRMGVGEDVFYLTREEMVGAVRGQWPVVSGQKQMDGAHLLALIEQRRLEYRAEGKVVVPNVIDREVVERLGEEDCAGSPDMLLTRGVQAKESSESNVQVASKVPSPRQKHGTHLRGFAVSAGVARGRAVILRSPTEAGVLEKGYILVCPSTDPSWTPLFVNAAGLVMECGGTLSHGAVVAREMGLPAVVVPEATKLFQEGEEVVVDGTRGNVTRSTGLAAHLPSHAPVSGRSEGAGRVDGGRPDPWHPDDVDLNDTRVGRMMVPPVAGGKDRRAGRVRNVMAAGWGLFILAFFLLPPAWVYGPTLAFLDVILWPLVRSCGKAWTVALVAAGIATLMLVVQRVMTDNGRLREAKRRAGLLTKEAATLPGDALRRKALLAMAAPVQVRVLGAALVPAGMLLGPLVLPFVWFGARVDPVAWNAPAGTEVNVVATVDADCREAVRIEVPTGMKVKDPMAGTALAGKSDAAVQRVPEVRATLERLLKLYEERAGKVRDEVNAKESQTARDAGSPWELKVSGLPSVPADKAVVDLRAYLARGIPAQKLLWKVDSGTAGGRFEVTVAAGAEAGVKAPIVLGDDVPPAAKRAVGQGNVKAVEISYGGAKEAAVFWRPFKWFKGVPGMGRAAAWDAGWVWLYIVAYLPVLFGLRAVLKVA
jgi:rifampicin phosphotransferase